jgi:prophage regulatory protein
MHKIIRLPEVISTTGLARSTIYKKIAEKSFPKPISLGPKSVGWLERDVQAWVELRLQLSLHTQDVQ